MANQVPSFLASSKLIIKVAGKTVAYAQNLSFSDDMSVFPVGGIGSINNHALEPSMYMGRGQMTITNYSDVINDELSITTRPGNINSYKKSASDGDGNSMLRNYFLNPIMLLLCTTFDIDVYERLYSEDINNTQSFNDYGALVYRLEDCRINRYNIGWNVGSKVNETVGFVCLSVLDKSSSNESSKIST